MLCVVGWFLVWVVDGCVLGCAFVWMLCEIAFGGCGNDCSCIWHALVWFAFVFVCVVWYCDFFCLCWLNDFGILLVDLIRILFCLCLICCFWCTPCLCFVGWYELTYCLGLL